MRRPRTCLASTDSGGLGEPSVPTTGRCLQWLDGTGEGWGNLPGWRACSRLRPEVRPQGQKSLRRDAERRFRGLCFSAIREISCGTNYKGAPFGVPSPLKVEGRKLKAQLVRRRGN